MGKYLNKEQIFDAEEAEDLYANEEQLSAKLEFYEKRLAEQTDATPAEDRVNTLLEIARIQVERYQGADAWDKAMQAFELAKDNELWEHAVEACDAMFLSEGPESLKALGHAIWLGVTFPVNPELTVAVLQHLVDESPKGADTKAYAAAVAHYITSVRRGDDDDLTVFALQMVAAVADEHSHVTDQSSFDLWRRTLQLDKPEVFLPKFSGAIDQLVGENWWIDRDKIRVSIDEN